MTGLFGQLVVHDVEEASDIIQENASMAKLEILVAKVPRVCKNTVMVK